MNRRSAGAQLALPGLAPLCPHCGGRRTSLAGDAPRAGEGGEVVTGAEWHCADCGRSFWQLPSLGRGPAGR